MSLIMLKKVNVLKKFVSLTQLIMYIYNIFTPQWYYNKIEYFLYKVGKILIFVIYKSVKILSKKHFELG